MASTVVLSLSIYVDRLVARGKILSIWISNSIKYIIISVKWLHSWEKKYPVLLIFIYLHKTTSSVFIIIYAIKQGVGNRQEVWLPLNDSHIQSDIYQVWVWEILNGGYKAWLCANLSISLERPKLLCGAASNQRVDIPRGSVRIDSNGHMKST